MIPELSRNRPSRAPASEHLELALDASRAGTWHWDMPTGKVTWDERIEALHGLGPGEFRSCFEHWTELLHPDEVEGVLAEVQAALASPGVYDLLHRSTWADGSVHWIECRGRVTVDEAGNPTGTIGVAFDVTDRIRAETELRASRERFESLAQTLQESLLPPELPAIAGVDLAARYIPGGEGIDVGGDFYDVFPVHTGIWGVVIGDVCGKGVEAAKTTALIRYTARAAAAMYTDPAMVVAAVNAALRRELRSETASPWATMIFATLHEAPVPYLRIARAGHPAPLHVRSDAVELVEPYGRIVGFFDTCPVEVRFVELQPGEALVLYTDGITEAGRAEAFGEDRLRDCVRNAHTSEEIVAGMIDAVARHRPEVADDDIAVLALRAV